MSGDPLLDQVRAVNGAPGWPWTVVATVSGFLVGAGLVHGWWLLVWLGGLGMVAWIYACLEETCFLRYMRRRDVVIRAWHAEHPEDAP